MTQIPIIKGDDEKMRTKHGTITLILIQLFVISAIVGAVSPSVSAALNDADASASNTEFLEVAVREDVSVDSADSFKPEFVPGEVLVKFRTNIHLDSTNDELTTGIESINQLNKRFGAKEIKSLFSNIYKLTLPKDANILSAVSKYEADPNVEWAEPNGLYYTHALPDDTEYWRQWAHEVTQAELAWNITTGDPSVVIAIIDTGVDWNHPDLAANIWNNTDEAIGDANGDGRPGVAWVDDDGDGLVDEDSEGRNCTDPDWTNDLVDDDDENGFNDDIRGWDFVSVDESAVWPGEDPGPPDNDPMDFYGHGTHCAGIAAAVGNNSVGVAGVSWNCKIMAVRAGYKNKDGHGVLKGDDIALAIEYATNNGANIISMSFGGGSGSPFETSVMNAYEKGVLLVASAGNGRTDRLGYPALWTEVIAVSATDEADDLAFFSNYGWLIEVAAPGVNIYSTLYDDNYAYASGTSMACPYVAGVAALIWSRFGLENMTRDEVRFHLRNTTDDLGEPGFDRYYGYGRVNARWAVDHTSPEHDLRAWGIEKPKVLKPGTNATIKCTVLNFGTSNESNVSVRLLVNGSVQGEEEIEIIPSYDSSTVSFSWTPTTEGWYNLTSYVAPKENEQFLNNNALSTRVLVRSEEVIRVPEDFSMIQRAVSAADSGYTVQVASGTYYQHVLITKPLTLIGDGPGAVIIDGGGAREVFTVDYAGGMLYSVENVRISQFTIQNGGNGIGIHSIPSAYWRFRNISVSENTILNCTDGIYSYYAEDSSVSGNMILNCVYGIYMYMSSNWNISENTLSNNDNALWARTSNTNVSKNVLSNNDEGIQFVYLGYNTISENTLSNNGIAINLKSADSNTISENTLSNNDYGVYMWDAHTNTFYHNNFVDNNQQVDILVSPNNNWDDGYPSGGNYWSDYEEKYPNASEVDGSGIWNTTYIIDEWNNQDNYPLIHPWGSIQNVDTDLTYLTIQKAIDAPETLDDHTIEVKADTYYEEVVVNKSLTIIGEGPSTTIIDANENSNVITVQANNVNIEGFTIQNGEYGIYLDECNYSMVSGNWMLDNTRGIYLFKSDNNTITENRISNNSHGIYLYQSEDNVIHHNNFIDNNKQRKMIGSSNNEWNSTNLVGNYWNDYNGNDTNGDGIGDTNLPHLGVDLYPLMWKWFPGDLDGDGDVDWFDYGNFSAAYGYQMGDPDYNPLADLDYDGDVDRYDSGIFAQNYGKSIPY